MPRRFLRAIHRDRRRLLFVIALAFLAGCLFYARFDVTIHGIPLALVGGAIYAAVVGLAAVAVCLFLPGLRFTVEAIAISRLCVSAVAFAEPEFGATLLGSPFLSATVVVGGGFLVSRLVHGRIEAGAPRRWRDSIVPTGLFERRPVRVAARDWQHRFTGWVDGTVPARA